MKLNDCINTSGSRGHRPIFAGNHCKQSCIHIRANPARFSDSSKWVIDTKLLFFGLLFRSIDPETMQVVEGGIKEQTLQSMINLKAVLEAAKSSMDKVIKTTVFLKVSMI